MPPHPDLLRVEFLGITVRHEDRPLGREQLAFLFAEVSERYGLNRLEFGTDGGVQMTGGNGSELSARTGQTASCAITSLGFAEGNERVHGLMGDALGHIGATEPLWIDDITLVAIWDCDEPDEARRYLTDDVLALDDERAELLGDEDAAHGLRMWRRVGEGSVDIAIEPLHADTSKIYIRLVYSQDEPVTDLATVADRADSLNAYLRGPLTAFVRARARR
jgi:hypothetical protein